MLDVDNLMILYKRALYSQEVDLDTLMFRNKLSGQVALELLRTNQMIWMMEDKARSVSESDAVIANLKRAIDVANQQRNDLIEDFDDEYNRYMKATGYTGPSSDAVHDSETLGSMADKLAIMEIRQYYLEKIVLDLDMAEEVWRDAHDKLDILLDRKYRLVDAMQRAIEDSHAGRRFHTPARQLKLYNDSRYNPNLKE